MEVIHHFFISFLLVVGCIIIHSSATVVAYKIISRKHTDQTIVKRILFVDLIVITLMVATILEGVLWASIYQLTGAFTTFQESLYFSMVTYTTLGYGDLLLTGHYRIMGALEAANGVIMLGWSTAIVVFTIQKIYFTSSVS